MKNTYPLYVNSKIYGLFTHRKDQFCFRRIGSERIAPSVFSLDLPPSTKVIQLKKEKVIKEH